jgi:hypothetical protein
LHPRPKTEASRASSVIFSFIDEAIRPRFAHPYVKANERQ